LACILAKYQQLQSHETKVILTGAPDKYGIYKLSRSNSKLEELVELIQHDFDWNGTTGGPPIVVNRGDVVQINIINSGLMAHYFGIAKLSQQSLDLMKQTD
jgi:hypothetical protein